jgi:glycosyltransferase involved in cell wall biosynthesis
MAFMNIGFISTRIAGVDGVSLEVDKWATVLRRMGHQTFFCAGELDKDAQPGLRVPEFHFHHPEALAIHNEAFSGTDESRELYRRITHMAAQLKEKLYEFVETFRLDVIITQNVQAIPMHIPLGVALRDFIAETHMPTIAHHHDFYFERERFLVNRIPDVLMQAFPAIGTSIHHVVISTVMARELYIRTRMHATYIPNVFDFRTGPPPQDDVSKRMRADFGIAPDDILVLQPTRIVRRKNIERAVELVRMLEDGNDHHYRFVVTGYVGDEPGGYYDWLLRGVTAAGIRALFVGDRVAEHRASTKTRQFYSLWDVYPNADLVTYLSSYEGFGNALIETLFFRKPLVVNTYPVYRADIQPAGVQAVEIAEEVTPDTCEAVRAMLHDPHEVARIVDHNYQVGLEHFSYEVLETRLAELLEAIREQV